MKIKIIFWVLAVIITLGTAYYQRLTGPTYPVKGKMSFGEAEVKYNLPRSSDSIGDEQVRIYSPAVNCLGKVKYKRYKTEDEWTEESMVRAGNYLASNLPHQPPAGKIVYQVFVSAGNEYVPLTEEPIIIRFKGQVPLFILIPHILLMFAAMLLSNLSGLMAAGKAPQFRMYSFVAFFLLLAGGMIMGPVVQKYAFGEFWTGVPYGWDLTDNKTLIAFIGWLAAIALNVRRENRWSVIVASVLLLLIYSIPHSMFGSELDYSSGKVDTGQ